MIEQVDRGRRRPLRRSSIVSSISAYTASINRGDYCVAKAGLAMMTTLYAARLAEHGINVYEIRPGVIETDMTGPVKERYDQLIHNRGAHPDPPLGTAGGRRAGGGRGRHRPAAVLHRPGHRRGRRLPPAHPLTSWPRPQRR